MLLEQELGDSKYRPCPKLAQLVDAGLISSPLILLWLAMTNSHARSDVWEMVASFAQRFAHPEWTIVRSCCECRVCICRLVGEKVISRGVQLRQAYQLSLISKSS